MTLSNPTSKTGLVLAWLARIISTVAAFFFITMVIGEGLNAAGPVTFEGVMVCVFAVILTAGVLFAWAKRYKGGIVLTVLGVAFAVFIYLTSGANRVTASILMSSPFWVSGILFLLTGKESRTADA